MIDEAKATKEMTNEFAYLKILNFQYIKNKTKKRTYVLKT